MKGRSGWKRWTAQDLLTIEKSPELFDCRPKQVVIVMDGLKEFSMEPLEWVLKNIAILACCTITLLGVMPWLNIPLSSKTWSEIWTFDLEDPLTITSKSEWKSDAKYQKIQQLITLCRKYGVVPQIKTEMGFPLRLLVVEQISSSSPTLVVFDRHQKKKHIKYFARKVPCNMIKMNEGGEVDMIKFHSHIDSNGNNTGGSTPSLAPTPPTPMLLLSDPLKKKLKLKAPQELVREREIGNCTVEDGKTLAQSTHLKRLLFHYVDENPENRLTSGTSNTSDLSYDNFVLAH